MHFLNKIISRYNEGVLLRQIKRRLVLIFIRVKYLVYIFYDPNSSKIKIISTNYKIPSDSSNEKEIVKRIFNSFKKMKEDQSNSDEIYLPSSLWQDDLDYGYSYLSEAINKNDIDHFHFFLSNFGAWKRPTGIEYNSLIQKNSKSRIGRSYLRNGVFNNQMKIWNWFYNNSKDNASLNLPNHGNLQGAKIDNIFLVPGSYWNEIYGTTLSNLLVSKETPIIAELGGGYGKLAHYIIKNLNNFIYIDFDLPETLCLAAYFLMMSYPDKKVLLYGENEIKDDLNKYNFVFFPSFAIEKLEKDSIDLFLNRNSLGEMSGKTAKNFVKIIKTKVKKYFFHMNHNNVRNFYREGDHGILSDEYDISDKQFKLLFKYPDLGHLTYRGGLDFNEDIFLHLYEKEIN